MVDILVDSIIIKKSKLVNQICLITRSSSGYLLLKGDLKRTYSREVERMVT